MKDKTNNAILVLPSWYPSEMDPTSGDFIARHIEAISGFWPQQVIYVVKDPTALVTHRVKTISTQRNNYSEEIIYYHPVKTGIGWIDKFISHKTYIKIYKKAIKNYLKNNGLPKMVHVHVAQKAGLLAYWLKKKYKIAYLLSEHWTAYLKEADLKISDHSMIFQRANKKIVLGAKEITVVSNYLGEAIKSLYPAISYRVLPNVVNINLLPSNNEKIAVPPVFVHASTQNYQKNTEAIIDAAALLKQQQKKFQLQLFGPKNNSIAQKIAKLQLQQEVFVMGNVPQPILFNHIKKATAVILYSRFETFGCVLIEAQAMGVPVIVSNLPVFKEIVSNGVQGLYAGNNDPVLLALRMQEMIDGVKNFNAKQLSSLAEKYNYSTVGKQFYELIRQKF